MKIATYSILTLAFSALIFTPMLPKQYPSEKGLEQKRIITYKEERLKRAFKNLEYQVTKDSLEIQSLKRNFN